MLAVNIEDESEQWCTFQIVAQDKNIDKLIKGIWVRSAVSPIVQEDGRVLHAIWLRGSDIDRNNNITAFRSDFKHMVINILRLYCKEIGEEFVLNGCREFNKGKIE